MSGLFPDLWSAHDRLTEDFTIGNGEDILRDPTLDPARCLGFSDNPLDPATEREERPRLGFSDNGLNGCAEHDCGLSRSGEHGFGEHGLIGFGDCRVRQGVRGLIGFGDPGLIGLIGFIGHGIDVWYLRSGIIIRWQWGDWTVLGDWTVSTWANLVALCILIPIWHRVGYR